MSSLDNVIKDTDEANFVSDVIEASNQVPIVVDFWAPWCGPCKKLTPDLERNILSFKGKVRLVKINVDENQGIASQLRIQSIPAVYGFYGGKPIDGFMGAQPEAKLKEFISGLISKSGGEVSDNLDNLIGEADEKLDTGLIDEAEEIYEKVLEENSNHIGAYAGLIRAKIIVKNLVDAQNILDSVPEVIKGEKAFEKIQAEIDLSKKISATRSLEDITSDLSRDPNNLSYMFELSLSKISSKDYANAIEQLLKIFEEDPNWENGRAKDQLLQLFESLGHDDPLVLKGRRKLSSIVFS